MLVVINDSFAYFCGKLFGKHKLIEISPNKTVEGFVGASIFTLILAKPALSLINRFFVTEITDLQLLIFATYVATIAPSGGFYASMLKRALGIKDFSNLIPGHGGVMDRCDCQLVSGFVLYLIMKIE